MLADVLYGRFRLCFLLPRGVDESPDAKRRRAVQEFIRGCYERRDERLNDPVARKLDFGTEKLHKPEVAPNVSTTAQPRT